MATATRRKARSTKAVMNRLGDPEVSHLAIAVRAYGIWLQQGRPVGQSVANWLQAEHELRLAAVSEDDVAHEAL